MRVAVTRARGNGHGLGGEGLLDGVRSSGRLHASDGRGATCAYMTGDRLGTDRLVGAVCGG